MPENRGLKLIKEKKMKTSPCNTFPVHLNVGENPTFATQGSNGQDKGIVIDV